MELEDAAVHDVQREVFESSLRSARATLELLGFDRFQARELADDFRRYSNRFVKSERASRHDEDDFVQRVRESREQFEKQMQQDLQRQTGQRAETGWVRSD
jgi:glutathione-regulated potassium-efflux system ancillary protein KefC